MFSALTDVKIGVIGLGYVGLPLAVAFSRKFPVVGFDINSDRIAQLNQRQDDTREVSSKELEEVLCPVGTLQLTDQIRDIQSCNFYIVTVPTPVDKQKFPDLSPLRRVSAMIGQILKPGDVVVYESTVYPGATEEECVPALEKFSSLTYNIDFYVGYSPERVNPGDKGRSIVDILKITSGSTPEAAAYIDEVYKNVIRAGTHRAPSIQVAEAAKVVENAQRDVNIAFVNELAKIFNRLEIDTTQVLEAASTKWNFLSFKPGLVGGHCIGVDPYYLAQKAQKAGYHPEVILSGRKINDEMGEYVGHEVVKLMVQKDMAVKHSRVLILGFTFKENCPDVRNTKVFDVKMTLEEYGIQVEVYDPWANGQEVERLYQFRLLERELQSNYYDAVILAVAHEAFGNLDIRTYLKDHGLVYDIKGFLPVKEVDARL